MVDLTNLLTHAKDGGEEEREERVNISCHVTSDFMEEPQPTLTIQRSLQLRIHLIKM